MLCNGTHFNFQAFALHDTISDSITLHCLPTCCIAHRFIFLALPQQLSGFLAMRCYSLHFGNIHYQKLLVTKSL